MAKWSLGNLEIPAPHKKKVKLDIQNQTNRSLNGAFSRDYIGNEKKVIVCEYEHISLADYSIIAARRQQQIETGLAVELTINEDGFQFNGNVIIELPEINFHIPNHYRYRNITITFIEV